MPIEEMLIAQMAELTQEINKEGLTKKIKLSQSIIALLYVYLKRLGLSDTEMKEHFSQQFSKEESENEV